MKSAEIIIQFIPIIIIFVLLKFSKQFVSFSFTILGKLLAITMIIFYSSIDIIIGLFICCLFILYYQSDYVENMLNLNDSLDLEFEDIIASEQLEFDYDVDGVPDDGVYLVPMAYDTKAKKQNPNKIQKKQIKIEQDNERQTKCENMENYSIYDNNLKSNTNKDLIAQFQKENCVNNKLKYKDMIVKNDMSEHVFSELIFENGQPCNPCNMTCKYSIIEEKLKTEEKMKPAITTK